MAKIHFKHFALLLMLLLVSFSGNAQIQPLSDCDEDPVFLCSKNGNAYDLDDYVARHLIYPREQIRTKYLSSVRVNLFITANGTVDEIEILDDDVHDSLKKELFRVLSKTIWTPGLLNDEPVSCWYNTNVKLHYIFKYRTPKGDRLLERVKGYIGKTKKYNSGIKKKNIEKIINDFSKLYELYPVIAEINNPYARMLVADGCAECAHEVLRAGIRDTSDYTSNRKSEILGNLLSAIIYEREGDIEEAKETYHRADSIINRRIIDKHLGSSIIDEDPAFKRRHYIRTLVAEGYAVEKNTTDWYYKQKVENEWSFNKIHEIASEMIERGLLSSGAVNQNRDILSKIYSEKTFKTNDYNLLAIRSLVTRLSEGEDVEKAQLISMIADEKVSDKVRKQLQELYDQVEALKLSKDEIVNNVIMYAPVQDPSKTKEENKAAATEFYRIRDAINDVYHLDWLEKK